jgi:hypothetical protein
MEREYPAKLLIAKVLNVLQMFPEPYNGVTSVQKIFYLGNITTQGGADAPP